MKPSAALSPSEARPVALGIKYRAAIWCAVLLAMLVVSSPDALSAMLGTWSTVATYNHGFLILPISLYLIWMRRRELATLEPEQEPLALVPLAAGATLWLVSAAAEVATLQEIALVGMALATVLFCFGWPIAKRLAFPLLFLFFMVPIGDVLIPPLQAFTADVSVRLLRLSGVPVYRDGNLIQTPSGMFLIAAACAGLRFLIANIVVATLFSYLAYDKWWKRSLFMGIAVIVPVLANGLRAFGIIYLAYVTDNQVAAGADHVVYGWAFFSLVMLILLAIGSTFADPIHTRQLLRGSASEDPASYAPPRARTWHHAFAWLAIATVVAAPAYLWTIMWAPVSIADERLDPNPIVSTWAWTPSKTSDWQPQFPRADRTRLDIYQKGDDEVVVFVAYYRRQRRDAEVIYYANSMADGTKWSTAGSSTVLVHRGAHTVPAHADYLVSSSHRRVVVWWYWVNGELTDSAMRAKILQLTARLLHRNQAAAVFAVSVAYDDDRDKAILTADQFLRDSIRADEYLAGLGQQP